MDSISKRYNNHKKKYGSSQKAVDSVSDSHPNNQFCFQNLEEGQLI